MAGGAPPVIETKTPFRISLFGGSSDYPAHYTQHGGEVLGFAINHYCRISIRKLPPFFEYKHRIVYSQIELVRSPLEVQHPAVREALLLEPVPYGVTIHHDGDLPARSGLGSSSAFVVGLLNALSALKGHRASPKALVETSIHIERDRLKENVGSQDQVWAAHGGFNRIRFNPDHSYEVHPLVIAPDRKAWLQDHLLLFFTGFSRNATDIAAGVVDNLAAKAEHVRAMQAMVPAAEAILTYGDIRDLGGLLHEAWTAKKRLASGVSTREIDEIYAAGLAAGASGGKLLGAGGGGFMLFFAPPEQHQAIRDRLHKLVEVQFKIGAPGSSVVLYEPEGL